jgi:transposase-like protein
MGFPETLQQFQSAFPDEETCWQALRRARWPRGFRCPRCQGRASSWIATRAVEQCSRCRYQCSVTAGTVFHGTRTKLRVWFWAIFFLARHKKGISALQFQRDTGLGSYETAWTMLHKLRSALAARSDVLLSGLVEVDETYVGSHEVGRRGGREVLNKSIVVAAVEQREHTAGRARLQVVDDVTFERSLEPFVTGCVDRDQALVRTDGFGPYRRLEASGIRHERIVQGPRRARSKEILPWSHITFGNLKTWLRGTFHGVSAKHLQRYLDEFTYRFDRRWNEGQLGDFILRRAATSAPLPYRRLVAEPAG